MKRALRMKLKAFFMIFKELSLKQIKQFFVVGESLALRSFILFLQKVAEQQKLTVLLISFPLVRYL